MQKEVEKIFVDLIKTYLALPDTYGKDENGNDIPTVVIRGQNVKLFNTPKLQVTVATLGSNVFANRREQFEMLVEGQTVYCEKVFVNEQRQMQIDVYSRNNEARQRFWEVQAALNSDYCQQLQDKYQFRVSKMSNSFNTSGLEGGSDINRFSIRFNCLTWQEKVTPINYYDKFRTQARDTNTNIFADFIIGEIGEWNQPYFSLVNYSNIQNNEYLQYQGGFSNYTNFEELEGGFVDYEKCKEVYKRVGLTQ